MSDGLLAAAEATPSEEATEEATEVSTEESGPSWVYAEGLAGEGEKPEWFKDSKYKSISDQAKAYASLESKLGGFTGAPEEYELSMPDGVEGEWIEGDPMMDHFKQWAKDSGLNQDKFTELLHLYVKNDFDSVASSQESELAALGDNAQPRLRHINDFAKANLSEDDYAGLNQMATTAASVKAIESLIALSRTPKIPTDNADTASGLSHSDIKERMNDPRYKSDPEFRKETSKLYERKFGTGPTNTTIG